MTDTLNPDVTDDASGEYLRERETELSPAARVAALEARKEQNRQRIADAREQAAILRENRRGLVADAGVGIVAGAITGAQELVQSAGSLGRWLEEKTGLDAVVTFDGDIVEDGLFDIIARNEFERRRSIANIQAGEEVVQGTLEDVSFESFTPDTERGSGGATKGVTQFLTGFIPALRATRAVNGFRGATAVRAVVAGAAADATAFDPHEERLSDLVQSYPSLQNPVTEYLAADPTDSEAEGRFKNALEGIVIGGAVDGLLRALRIIRARRRMQVEAEVDQQVRAETVEVPEPRQADEVADGAADSSLRDEPPVQPEAPDAAPTAPQLRVRPEDIEEFQRRVADGDISSAKELIDFNASTIDFESIEDGDTIRRLINTTSETFESLIDDAKGGVQTIEQTKRLARQVGGTESDISSLFSDVRGDKGITARVMAAEQTMIASAQRLRELARAVVDNGDNASRMALARHIELHGAIQAQVKGAKAEIARALHAMRVMKQASAVDFDEFSEIGRQLGNDPASAALAKQLAEATDLNVINQLTRKTRWQRFREGALEVWINGLLSSPKTHVVNALSNTVKSVEASLERFIAAGIGGVRRGVFRQSAEVVQLREAANVAVGTLQGLRDAVMIPAKLGRGEDALPFLDTKSKLEVDTNKAIQFGVEGTEGLRRVTAQAGNLLGSAIRIPGSALQASDNVFKTIAYRQQANALAYRQAAREADEQVLRGTERSDFIANRIAELADELPEDLHLASADFARYQTFTNELGDTGRAFQGFLARVPVLRFVFPFVRTPTNIIKQVAERTPLPLLRVLQRDYREALLRGGPDADLALARIGLGTGLMYAAWEMTDAGLVTGGGIPGRNTEDLKGIKPYSVKIGNEWYVYNRLEPLGMLMGTMADFREIVDRNFDPDGDNTELEDAARMVLFGTLKNVTSKTYLRGASEFFQVLSDPERYGDRYLQNFSGSLIPFSGALRAAKQADDPYAREAFGYLENLKSNLPGLSRDLPARRDILGRPIVPGTHWLSPIQVSVESDDPLDLELSRLQFAFRMPSRQIEGIPLNAAQYSEFLRIRGQESFAGKSLEEALREFIRTNEYRALPEDPDGTFAGTKQDAIKRLISRYQQAAKERLLEDDSELRQKVDQERTRRRPTAAVTADGAESLMEIVDSIPEGQQRDATGQLVEALEGAQQ